MAFFAQIPPADFEDALQGMLAKNKRLRPVTDLKSLDGEVGIYVMVLDEYREAYIGQSWDMRKRIRAHWNRTKQFDRLLWGGVEESVVSIDASGPWTPPGSSPRRQSTTTPWRPGS